MTKTMKSSAHEPLSALGSHEASLGWDIHRWKVLFEGSEIDSSMCFREIAQCAGGTFLEKSTRLNWAIRFGHLKAPWRVFAAALDEARLGELLSGNLTSDDSGIDSSYAEEREALHMLCALRVFKESELFKDDPDPRINSLRRIKLGRWREFAQVGAPGFNSGSMSYQAALLCKAGRVAQLMSSSALAQPSRYGLWASFLLAWAAGTVLFGVLLALGFSVQISSVTGVLGWLIVGNSNIRGLLREVMTRKACDKVLQNIGAPSSSEYGRIVARGLSAAAKQVEGIEAQQAAHLGQDVDYPWGNLSADCRKKINQERTRRAQKSLDLVEASWALDEHKALLQCLNTLESSGLEAASPTPAAILDQKTSSKRL